MYGRIAMRPYCVASSTRTGLRIVWLCLVIFEAKPHSPQSLFMNESTPLPEQTSLVAPTEPPTEWSNKRILTLLALGTLIVSAIWHLPQEASYLNERAGELLLTLALAIGFTYVMRPAVNFLCRSRKRTPNATSANATSAPSMNRTWATLLVFILCGALLYIVFAVGLRPVTHDVVTLWNNFIPANNVEKVALFEKWQNALSQTIAPYRDALPPEVRSSVEAAVAVAASSFPKKILGSLQGSFSHIGFLVELLLLPVLVFYFLADGRGIRNEVRLLLPSKFRASAARMANHLDRVLDGYIRGQMWMCVIAWIVVSLGLWLLRVPHALTLGFLAGLTRAVPVIGPLLGGMPIVLVCLLTTRSVPLTLTVLTGFILMHFVESKVLLPKIIGHEVDLHPVSVIVVLLLGLEFFGFIGVFLAVPVAAVIKVLLCEWHDAQEAKIMSSTVAVQTSSTR